MLQNIFQPFNRSRQETLGKTGFHLGLYIVKEFMEILQGEITITSREGRGTTVQLFFPVDDQSFTKNLAVDGKSQEPNV